MVHKIKNAEDYKEALSGEGWAINDYKDMISKVKTKKEKRILTHIMNEEVEHQKELIKLMSCKVK
jgi:rubrerythrin